MLNQLVIKSDHGPEFISHEYTKWAGIQGICLEYIQPSNPQQNAYVEGFYLTARYSWVRSYSDLWCTGIEKNGVSC